MTVGELQDQVGYEGSLTNIDAIGGAVIQLLKEALDTFSNQTRYNELFKAQEPFVLSVNQTSIPIPVDLQHLDTKHIQFQPGGDDTKTINLRFQRNYNQLNQGLTTSCYRDYLGDLNLYPNGEIAQGDILLINYWIRPSTLITSEASVIPVQSLIPTLKGYIISRLQMATGDKSTALFMQASQQQHSLHFGAVDLSDCNGE